MEGEGSPFRRGFLLPPNLPHPPRTSPRSTRLCSAIIWFALYGAGALGGSFFGLGGRDLLQGAASHSVGERLFGRKYAERHMGRFLQWRFTAALQGTGMCRSGFSFLGGFSACQCLSSTTSIGSLRTHLPSVKSGIACGAPPCAIEASDSTETHIHAAAS